MSIASFMSVASTSNPYLNSNCMFKNLDSKPNNNYNNNNRISENMNLEKEELNKDFLANENQNEQDDIEYYLKLKNSYSNDNFNDISKNFGNQVQQVIKILSSLIKSSSFFILFLSYRLKEILKTIF